MNMLLQLLILIMLLMMACWCAYYQESFDYIGSSRMAYDMRKRHMNFTVEDIEMFIEIGQVGLHSTENSDTLWLHTGLNESQQVIAFSQCSVVCCMSYTEWPKLSENTALYDCVIVDLTLINFTYLYC